MTLNYCSTCPVSPSPARALPPSDAGGSRHIYFHFTHDRQSRDASVPFTSPIFIGDRIFRPHVAISNLSSHNHLRRSESESLLQDLGRLPNSKLG
jgi:hypothetical protein